MTQTKQETVASTHAQSSILSTPNDELQYADPDSTLPPARRTFGQVQQQAAAKGLAQTFGLDIRAAILTILVDLLVFGGDMASFGALIPLAIAVAAVLAFIVFKIQFHWYKDDRDSALIKAMIVGLLTAIPVPIALTLIAIRLGRSSNAVAISTIANRASRGRTFRTWPTNCFPLPRAFRGCPLHEIVKRLGHSGFPFISERAVRFQP